MSNALKLSYLHVLLVSLHTTVHDVGKVCCAEKEEDVTLQDATTQQVSAFQSARRSPAGDLCELPSTSHDQTTVEVGEKPNSV